MPQRPPPTMSETGFNDVAMCRAGPMVYNRFDQYVGASLRKYGEFSAGETELFRRIVLPGMLVVEVGANIGAHTVELSRMVGPQGGVIAFEPQLIVFQTLCANLALNSCANVHAIHAAIGAEAGEITVPFLAPDRPNNFGGLSLIGATEGERVTLRRLDDFGLPACHVLKLDLEGMEVEAIKGGAATIAAHRPMMYVENDRPQRSEELIALLLGLNYQLYQHYPPLFSPTNYAEDPENIFGNIVSMNLLCVAAERNITIEGLPAVTG